MGFGPPKWVCVCVGFFFHVFCVFGLKGHQKGSTDFLGGSAIWRQTHIGMLCPEGLPRNQTSARESESSQVPHLHLPLSRIGKRTFQVWNLLPAFMNLSHFFWEGGLDHFSGSHKV